MRALQAYIEQQNRWNSMFGRYKPLEIDTPAGRQRVADNIDAALSPENITCDGELPRSQVQARYRQLTAVARDLLKLDPTVKFYEYAE